MGGILNSDGETQNLELLGTVLYLALIITVLMQIALETLRNSLPMILSHIVSIMFLTAYLITINFEFVNTPELLEVPRNIIESPIIILYLSVTPFICFLFSYS